MHCSLKLKKKKIIHRLLFFIHSLIHFSLNHSLLIHSKSLHSLKLKSLHSLKLKSQAHFDRRRPDHRQRHHHPPSASQAYAQLRLDRCHQSSPPDRHHRSSPPIINVNICFNMVPSRRSAQIHRRSTLSASDPPPSASDPRRRSECLLTDVVFVCDF